MADTKTKHLHLRITKKLKRALKREAKRRKMSMTALVEDLVVEDLGTEP